MTWLSKLFPRNPAQTARIEAAQQQQTEAAEILAQSRDVARRNRRHIERNHITEGFAAAFERRHA